MINTDLKKKLGSVGYFQNLNNKSVKHIIKFVVCINLSSYFVLTCWLGLLQRRFPDRDAPAREDYRPR